MPKPIIKPDGMYMYNWNKNKYQYISLEQLEKINKKYNVNTWIKKIKEKQSQQP